MKLLKHTSLITLLIIVLSSSVDAQIRKYCEFKQQDEVVFYKKIKPSKLFNKTSTPALYLKIVNSNEKALKITFNLAYYKKGVLDKESEDVSVCIPAGKTLRGKYNKMAFLLSGYKLEQFEKEEVSVEFKTFEIEEIKECKK